MSWEYIPHDRTLLKEVQKLKPGHMIAIDLNRPELEQKQYWDAPPPDQLSNTSTAGEWVERIDAQVQKSVKMQMVSDMPLGAFLSGGVDSSLVVAAMGNAHTFSIGFDDPTYNELLYACKVAAHLGVQHTTEIIQPNILAFSMI